MSILGAGLFPATASGQTGSAADISLGYSVLRDVTSDESGTDLYTGWVTSAAVPFWWTRLSIVGEAGSNARTNVVAETERLTAFLGGARIGITTGSRLKTWGQALVGFERFSEPGFSESGLAVQPGAGVDVRLVSAVGARVQADYRFAKQTGATYRELRVAVSAVFQIGR
jgi:hypothetical protein